MDSIVLERTEAFGVLGALEDASDHAITTGALVLAITVQDAAEILVDKLFPDLPQEG